MNIDNEIELNLTIRNNLLKERRLNIGLTQAELAEEVGISIPNINAMECFRHKEVTMSQIIKVSGYFGCNPEEIYPEYFKNIKQTYIKKKISLFQLVNASPRELLKIASNNNDENMGIPSNFDFFLDKLKPRTKAILKDRYWNNIPLVSLTSKYKISRERIRQIELKGIRELRKMLETKKVGEIL